MTTYDRFLCLLVWAFLPLNYAVRASDEIDFNRDIRQSWRRIAFIAMVRIATNAKAICVWICRSSHRGEGSCQAMRRPAASSNASMPPTTPKCPPAKSNRRLSDAQKQLLERWIKEGGKYLDHWAFTSPSRPPLPDVINADRCISPIDRFIEARLERAGLTASPPADRATLMKRLSIDLVGMPPEFDDVKAFVTDERPDAYER